MAGSTSDVSDSVVEDSHFDVLDKKYMEMAKEVPDDEYESQQKSLVEIVVAHRTAKHSAEDDPKKDTNWRHNMNDQSLLCMTRKAWKIKLTPEDYSVVHEFANFFKSRLRSENRSGFGAYRLYACSVEDAREYITLAKSQFENSIRSFDREPEGDILIDLFDQLLRIRKNAAHEIESDDYDRRFALLDLSDSALLQELKTHREGDALRSKNLLLGKLHFLNESYFTDMPSSSSSIEELQTSLSEAETVARDLENKRKISQNENVGKLIDLLVKRSEISPFTGVFGDISLDEEILEVFTILDLRDMFESPIRAIPSVDEIMIGSVKSGRKGINGDTKIASSILLFNTLFGKRGRWTSETYSHFCVTRASEGMFKILAFLFVLENMLKDNAGCPGCDEYNKHVKIMNEIDLFIQCCGTGNGKPLSVHNDDPRILTSEVQRYIKFVKKNGQDPNPYEEKEKPKQSCSHGCSHGLLPGEGPSGCGTQ